MQNVGSNLLDAAEQRRPALDAELRLAGGSGHPRRSRTAPRCFAGQRDDPFFVDLGGTFDLLSFRSAPPGAFMTGGVDGLRGYYGATRSRSRCRSPQLKRTKVTPTDARQHQLGGRRLRHGLAPGDRPQEGHGALAAGLAPRQPARQRGRSSRWARRTTGTASAPARRQAVRQVLLKPELVGARQPALRPGLAHHEPDRPDTIVAKGIPPKNGLGLPTPDRQQAGRRRTCSG